MKECFELFLNKEPKKTTVLELSDGRKTVNLDDIVYIGSEKHYIRYFIKDKDSEYYMCRRSLDEIQNELPQYFARIHQRYIVNLKYSTDIQRYVLTIKKANGETQVFPIARNRYEDVEGKYCLIRGDI